MSNRILGILILLWFVFSGILFYMYFFVYYMWNITVKSNVDNYKISLYNKKLLQTKNYNCDKKICDLKKISPFNYSFTITKSGYIDFNKDIEIWRNQVVKLNISLVKKTVLNEVKNEKIKEKTVNNREISIKDRIKWLINKKKSYYYKEINNQRFYFKEDWNYLRLYKGSVDLWSFGKVNKENIEIQEIIWNETYIFINLWKNKYIYSLVWKKKYLLTLNISISYIKNGLNDKEFLIITEKWAFIYNKFSLKVEYFDFFRDFVYYKSWYIWIIDKTDKRRLTNLGLENKTTNLIIYYDVDTKEKKILYESSLDIQKIYKKWEDIMFVSSKGKEYKLENY